MFKFFEKFLPPVSTPGQSEPPPGLVAFYWHFASQAKILFFGLFAAGFAVALLDVLIPVFIGRVVDLVSHNNPQDLLATYWPQLVGMAAVLAIARPIALVSQHLVMNQAIAANVSNRIRWQSHWHVVRQS